MEIQHGARVEPETIRADPPKPPNWVAWLDIVVNDGDEHEEVQGFAALQDAIDFARAYEFEARSCDCCERAYDQSLHVGECVGESLLGGNAAYWSTGYGADIDASACDGWLLCRSGNDGSIAWVDDRHLPITLEYRPQPGDIGDQAATRAIAAAVEDAEYRLSQWQEDNPLESYDDEEEDAWAREQHEDPDNLDPTNHYVWLIGRSDLVRNYSMLMDGFNPEDLDIANKVSCADLIRFKRTHGADIHAIEACVWYADEANFDYQAYNRRYPYSERLGRRYSFQAACQAARKVAADILADVDIDTLQDKPTGEPDDRDAELWIVAESEDSEGVKECMTVRASACFMRDECAVQMADLDAYAQWLVGLHGLDGIC